MHVPYYDLSTIHKELLDEFHVQFSSIVQANSFILGPSVEAFEKEFARFCGVKSCAGVACGLDAISLALAAAGIEANDEVIVPAHTYIATWLAVSTLGAKIVPVDACPKTMNIDVNQIESKITKKTKAIVPVHMYGQMCEMDTISALAKKYNLIIIEDFAQAQGAKFKNMPAGSIGDVNGTSFYPGKNLGALGDAGAVTSHSEKLIEKVKALRNYGSSEKYVHEQKGVNSRLDSIQATFLSIKLKHLMAWNEERRTIAQLYRHLLKDVPELTFQASTSDYENVYHLFVIRSQSRDELKAYLSKKGITTLIHYPIATFDQKAYQELNFTKKDFPIASSIAKEALSLPIYPGLNHTQMEYVCEAIQAFFKSKS